MRVRIAIAAALALGAWLLAPGRTDPKLLDVSWLRRAVRRYRSMWIRFGTLILGWPHIVEMLLGTGKGVVCATPSEEIWQHGPFRLLRYQGARDRGAPILIVHALVSQHWILDLNSPGASFVADLVGRGRDVFLLDWGEPDASDRHLGFDEYAAAVTEAECIVLRTTGAGALHLLGYCSGASLALMRLGRWAHETIASVTLIAPPVDLNVPGPMRAVMASSFLKPALAVDHRGLVPPGVIRESFHFLRPRALRSVWQRVCATRDAQFRAWYDPMSQWTWSHRAIPGKVLLQTVDLYRTNSLLEDALEIADRKVVLGSIKSPVLVCIADRDHIVPVGSSTALASVAGMAVRVLNCPSGHVSMITGRGAREILRPAVHEWLAKYDPKKITSRKPRPKKQRVKA